MQSASRTDLWMSFKRERKGSLGTTRGLQPNCFPCNQTFKNSATIVSQNGENAGSRT
jgi:hypothetical protein